MLGPLHERRRRCVAIAELHETLLSRFIAVLAATLSDGHAPLAAEAFVLLAQAIMLLDRPASPELLEEAVTALVRAGEH